MLRNTRLPLKHPVIDSCLLLVAMMLSVCSLCIKFEGLDLATITQTDLPLPLLTRGKDTCVY